MSDKINCSRCGRLSNLASGNPDHLCPGCRYLPKRKAEKTMLNAPAFTLNPTTQFELLQREAKRHKVGQRVRIGGELLERVDARSNKNLWSKVIEQPELSV